MSLCGIWDLPFHEPYTPGKWNQLHRPLLCYNILTFSASTHSSFALECSPPHLSRVKSFHFSRLVSLVVSLGKPFLNSLLEMISSHRIWFPSLLQQGFPYFSNSGLTCRYLLKKKQNKTNLGPPRPRMKIYKRGAWEGVLFFWAGRWGGFGRGEGVLLTNTPADSYPQRREPS